MGGGGDKRLVVKNREELGRGARGDILESKGERRGEGERKGREESERRRKGRRKRKRGDGGEEGKGEGKMMVCEEEV